MDAWERMKIAISFKDYKSFVYTIPPNDMQKAESDSLNTQKKRFEPIIDFSGILEVADDTTLDIGPVPDLQNVDNLDTESVASFTASVSVFKQKILNFLLNKYKIIWR
ncbi:hypothetical protein TNIN_408081 [Trichonephila inaurata madagascariensis]|uniref:Uncharacterized protein n=1 Tax=Trichonephila inaurata madagascariensis TaxID=2747483 RepID=A0A8X6MBM5_9ARAC|nr:hypothetical protein TNIN_408081 [Trichonephila inaurata madagascariensis]